MNSLAIPAASPASAASAASDNATTAAADGKFGDALRKTRDKPQTQAGSHPGEDAATTPKHAKPTAAGHTDDAGKDDKPAPTDHTLQPIPIAAAPLVAANLRHAPAASGKPLPPKATPPLHVLAGAAKTASAHATPATVAPQSGPAAAVPDAKPATTATPMPGLPAGTHAAGTHADTDGGTDAKAARPEPGNFTAHLGQLIGAHQTPAPGPMPAPVQLAMQATPQQQPQFAQETAQHVSWLAGKGIDKAEIQLNPRQLGPISVEITSHHDRVDVSFAVAHPQTVHALQQTLPQLHDMLAQQGLNLGQASVGQHSPGQQHAAFAQHAGSGNAQGGNTETDALLAPRSMRIATPGRVDDFA